MKTYQLVYLNEVQPIHAINCLREHWGAQVRLLTLPLVLIEAPQAEVDAFLSAHQADFEAHRFTLGTHEMLKVSTFAAKQRGGIKQTVVQAGDEVPVKSIQFEHGGYDFFIDATGTLQTDATHLKELDILWRAMHEKTA